MNPPGLNLSKTRRANHETFAYLHLTTWGTYKLRLHEYPTAGLDRDTVPRCTPSGIQKTVRTISLGGCRDVWWTAIFPEYESMGMIPTKLCLMIFRKQWWNPIDTCRISRQTARTRSRPLTFYRKRDDETTSDFPPKPEGVVDLIELVEQKHKARGFGRDDG